MPSTKSKSPEIAFPYSARVAAGVLAAVALAIGLYWFFRAPPQMGADPEVFRTVDALYTAVRSQNEKRLAQCEERLAKYREEGKLAPASADYLDGIIARARAGNWDNATRRLYDFMIGQRREGQI